MRKLLFALTLTILFCGPMLAKEFYQFPRTTTIEGRDLILIRRPAAAGFSNATGTRNISGTTIFSTMTSLAASKALLNKLIAQQQTDILNRVLLTDSRLTDARTPLAHNQGIATINGLQTALDGKEQTGAAAAAVAGHVAAANHPATTTSLPEGTNLYHTAARAAAAAPVQSVAGRTGAVSLTTADIAGYAAQVNSDWSATNGPAQILNQPATTCTGRYSWDGNDGTQVYFGSGVPAAGLGIEKDFYLNSANFDFYRKEGAPVTWTLKGNLKGPANVLSIGTITTLAYNQQATATITGTAPNQTLSLGLVQGVPGDPGTLTRKNITDKLLIADDTTIYIQPATNSATVGGVVINDFGGNAAFILQNGRFEVRDTGGFVLAKIDRAAGTIATYDAAGNLVAKMDRSGIVTAKQLVLQ